MATDRNGYLETSSFSWGVMQIFTAYVAVISVSIGRYRQAIDNSPLWNRTPERIVEARLAIWYAAFEAISIFFFLILLSAIIIPLVTNPLDERMSNIIEGYSRIISGVTLALLSIRVAVWVGLYYPCWWTEESHKHLGSTTIELKHRVRWSISRKFLRSFFFLWILFQGANDAITIPGSILAGLAAGFFVDWIIYKIRRISSIYRRRCMCITFVIFLSLVSIIQFALGAFFIAAVWQNGLDDVEETTWDTYVFYLFILLLPILHFISWRFGIYHARKHNNNINNTNNSLSTFTTTTISASSTSEEEQKQQQDEKQKHIKRTQRMQRQRMATSMFISDLNFVVRKIWHGGDSILSHKKESNLAISAMMNEEEEDEYEYDEDSKDETKKRPQDSLSPKEGTVASSKEEDSTEQEQEEEQQQQQYGDDVESNPPPHHPPHRNETKKKVAFLTTTNEQFYEEEDDNEYNNNSNEKDNTNNNTNNNNNNNNHHITSEPKLRQLLMEWKCCECIRGQDKPIDEKIFNTIVWIIYIVLCLIAIFSLFCNISSTYQQEYARSKLPYVHKKIYATMDQGPVCAFDNKGELSNITTFDNVNDAHDANFLVLHCGACGACSDWHNLRLEYTTRTFLAEEGKKCAMKSLFGGSYNDVVECLESSRIGFRGQCAICWADDILCTKDFCWAIGMQSFFINTLGNFQVNNDTITAAACEEAHCEAGNPGEFVKCSGATRRRMNVTSSIGRPGAQQCSIVDVDWSKLFPE